MSLSQSVPHVDAEGARPPLLQCSGLHKTYRDGLSPAVASVDLSVADGEFVTLLGSSGSGKSTTLMMVAGFERPDEGKVVLEGADITDVPAYRRHFGFVFQSYLLFPHMTVFQNVAFPLRMRRMSKQVIRAQVMEVLAQVRLEAFAERLPRQLSGGQQQRVAVARAVVGGPRLLLMDEPLGALDERLRYDLQQEIRKLHKDLRTSILYVTHDQQEAMSLSDRIVLMRDGAIEQNGSPMDLYQRPQSSYVARFMGEATFLAAAVVGTTEAGLKVVKLAENGAVLEVPGVPGLVSGDSADLMLRASALRLRSAEPGAASSTGSDVRVRFEVTVEDVAYVGEGTRIVGTTAGGEPFKVVAPNVHAPTVGDRCQVELLADEAWCIPAGTTPAGTL